MKLLNSAQKKYILKKLLIKVSTSTIKHQSHLHPKKLLTAIYCKSYYLMYRQCIYHPWKKNYIPPLDQFGEMYTISFPSGGSNMVQSEIFEIDPTTSGFTMDNKIPDSTSIEASPGTNRLFETTYEYHLHSPCTSQWYLTSTHNIDLVWLSLFLKSFTLRGDQVINLRNFHNNLSIALSEAANTNIEALQ